jgi:FtsZ-interacting cell division protein ZipA
MTGAVIANWPLSLIIFVAIVALVLVPTYRFRHKKPSHRDAREHFRVKEQVDKGSPEAVLTTPDYVPAERVNPLDGLTVPQDPDGPAAGGPSGQARRRPAPGDVPER